MIALVALPLFACSDGSSDSESSADADDPEHEEEGTAEGALTGSSVSCNIDNQPAYSGGSRLGTVKTFKIGSKRVAMKSGNAFLVLQKKAAARGVSIWLNSGFRTMDEQRHLYYCYTSGSCNSGNLAARPGYSNHQNGRALDIGTDNRARLNQIIRDSGLDWRRTVPSEAWHYEYFGADPGGPCD